MAVRIGDKEREAAVERLSKHAAEGRLTMAELEERVGQAHAAVYADELHALEVDLPPSRRPVPTRPLPLAPLALLLVAVALTVAVGHPVVPLFILAAFLWRARRPGRPRGLPPAPA